MIKLEKRAEDMTLSELASYIDYSVLKPEFTTEQIVELTKDGVQLGCATICINPGYMDLCKPLVQGSKTKLCPVCDFPFGTSSTQSKVAQAKILVDNYADVIGELDIVSNFGLIRSGKYDEVTADIKAVVDVCHEKNVPVKVIFETDALTVEQVKKACHCAIDAKADFVKTSTGFLTGYESHGATPEIIKIMQDEVQDQCKVKGSGCIRTREHFLQLINMGIDRMGVGYRSVPVVLDLNK
ncbi:deoxyribose-phosphate aldolase [Floccifex sp.]|uniref:deoxyribose-phosphate aldolase n=1 Tax=Floccifex sp. TaxID=2815810 RepID=UPI003F7385F4